MLGVYILKLSVVRKFVGGQHNETQCGEDKFVGGLHIEMAIWNMLGDYLVGSGYTISS